MMGLTEEKIRKMPRLLESVQPHVQDLILLLAREVDQLRDQVQDHFHREEEDL